MFLKHSLEPFRYAAHWALCATRTEPDAVEKPWRYLAKDVRMGEERKRLCGMHVLGEMKMPLDGEYWSAEWCAVVGALERMRKIYSEDQREHIFKIIKYQILDAQFPVSDSELQVNIIPLHKKHTQ